MINFNLSYIIVSVYEDIRDKDVSARRARIKFQRGLILMETENIKKKYFATIEETEVDEEGRVILAEETPVEQVEEPTAEEVEEVAEAIEEVTEEQEIGEEGGEAQEEIAAADAAVAFEAADAEAVIDSAAPAKPKYVNKSFAQKMLVADEVIQDRYDELKNYALRYKKIKARISKKFDSFNKGRLQFIKLSVAGKTLKLYLNMDIATTDPKFHCKDVSDKKTYVATPVLLRIKSGRAVKYAKILIDRCAELYELKENKKFVEVDAIALVEAAAAPKQKAKVEEGNEE